MIRHECQGRTSLPLIVNLFLVKPVRSIRVVGHILLDQTGFVLLVAVLPALWNHGQAFPKRGRLLLYRLFSGVMIQILHNDGTKVFLLCVSQLLLAFW